MIRSEERLQVATETVETEKIRLKKYIKTELVTVIVPVKREKIRIERQVINRARESHNGDLGMRTAAAATTATTANTDSAMSNRTNLMSTGSDLTGAESGSSSSANLSINDDVNYEWVTLHEERPVVRKVIVPTERIRLRKEVEERRQTVADEIRKEQIDFEKQDFGVDLGTQYIHSSNTSGRGGNTGTGTQALAAHRPPPIPPSYTATPAV